MKIGTTGLALAAAALLGGQAPVQAIAQAAPQSNATPSPGNAPVATMPPPVITMQLPPTVSETPVPVVVPTAQPTPTPPARREVEPRPIVRATPQPTATPRARSAPVAAPAVAPEPTPTPTPTPAVSLGTAPIASPRATPTPSATPIAVPTLPDAGTSGWPKWLVPAAIGGLLVLIIAFFLWRRRRVAAEAAEVAQRPAPARFVPPSPPAAPVEPEPAPLPEPSPPSPAAAPQFLERPAPSERAWLDLAAPTVHRAGVNLVTATADVSLTVRNEGSAPARDIRLAILLTSAQPGQDAVLDALYAEPVARPIVPPFTLAPGDEKVVRGLATMPREAIVALSAADRPMFVPVVALNAVYDAAGGAPGQTTAAFAVGVERADGAKLAPMWLDEPSRMYDAIAIRAHGTTVKR